MMRSWQSKLIVAVIFLVVGGLGWRLLGCGGPLLPDNTNKNPDRSVFTDPSTYKDPVIESKTPTGEIATQWTDTRIQAQEFHYTVWYNKPWVWYVQDQKTEIREVFVRETPTGAQLGLMPRSVYPGVMEEIIVKDNKLYAVGKQSLETGVGLRTDTRMIQVGQPGENTDTIQWFTVRTFRAEEYDEAKYLAFLGNTLLFYGQKNIYTLDPKTTQPELLKLAANMYPNVNYMKCSNDFCLALVNNYIPLLFSADTKWKTVPNFVYWVALPTTTTYPFASETTTIRETFNQEFTKLVEQGDLYLRERLSVENQRAAFLLRDRYVFWSCAVGQMPIQQRNSIDKIQMITWAQNDLLVLFPKTLVLVRKDKAFALSLPKELVENTYTLHRIRYQNKMLYLEATVGSSTILRTTGEQKLPKRTLFIAPYNPGHAQSVCSP